MRRAICSILILVLLAGCGNPQTKKVLRKADALVARNQLEEAYVLLEDYYQDHPSAFKVREAQIILLLKSNQTENAIKMYKDLIKKTKLLTFLNEIISNTDPVVRANVCTLIAHTKPSNSVYLLTRAARDREKSVRQPAVFYLRQFEGEKVAEVLQQALLDPSWQVRAVAAGSIESLRDPSLAEHLFQAMLDPDEYVQLKVRRALEAAIADSNLHVYRRALRHSNMKVRSAAALALATRRDFSALPVLYEALRDSDYSVRLAAVRALAHLGERAVRPLLREALGDVNPNVRAAAALALADLGDVVSTNQLAVLAQTDPAVNVRLAAAQAFQILSPPQLPLAPPSSP